MKIKNIEKRGNRKEGVNLIIEVLEKDVIPKGNRKLLNRRNFYKQHLTSLGFSHVRGKYVIQLDDENEIETMQHPLYISIYIIFLYIKPFILMKQVIMRQS